MFRRYCVLTFLVHISLILCSWTIHTSTNPSLVSFPDPPYDKCMLYRVRLLYGGSGNETNPLAMLPDQG